MRLCCVHNNLFLTNFNSLISMPIGRVSAVLGLLIIACCSPAANVSAQDKPVQKRPPWTASHVHGSPEPPAPYKIVPAFPRLKFELPTSLEVIPGTNRMLVTERAGRILSFANSVDAPNADLVVDLRDLLPSSLTGQNISLFDAALHPRFSDNRYLFVTYVHPGGGGQTRVSRLTLSRDEAPRLVPGTEQVVITWPSGGHNAGCLEFGTDGYLYIATGDGSGPNPPDARNSGQDISDLFGAILRIDVH